MNEMSMAVDEDSNLLLVNALKAKLETQTVNSADDACIVPKFIIPALRSAQNSISTEFKLDDESNDETSSLNDFLLAQLLEKHSNSVNDCGGFILPQLQIGSSTNTNQQQCANKNFVIPLLKSSTINSNEETATDVDSLSNSICELKLDLTEDDNEDEKADLIDLTTALNSDSARARSKAAELARNQQRVTTVEEFDIPFIACDLVDTRKAKKKTQNQRCEMDISNKKFKHSFVAPSNFGRIACLKYTSACPLPQIQNVYKPKHKIKHFGFDTESPDNKVETHRTKSNRKANDLIFMFK